MFFDKRVFLVASVLQSVATVDGRKAQQELVRDGPTKTEGCGQDRCALWDIPTDWGVPLIFATSLFESFGVYDSSCILYTPDYGSGDCTCVNDIVHCPFTTPYFNELEWTTRLDKDALCQICLSPPRGNLEEALVFFKENAAYFEGYHNEFQHETNEYQYAIDDLECEGYTFPLDECKKCLEATTDEELGICMERCDTQVGDYYERPDELNPFPLDRMWLLKSDRTVNFINPPKYKKISKMFWSEDGSQPNTGDDYYCANRFQNYLDPCCLESLAPSMKTTPPPTTIDGGFSLAPTTASDDNPCFSESSTVEVQGKGKVTMKSLLVGDVVLTPSGYEKVYTIDHRSEEKPTDFIQIHTEIEEPLEVTGTHLIFKVGKSDPVEARSIVVGDELQGYFNGEMKSVVVEKINSISKNGLYNPITTSGTIVVDGLVTSTYTAVNLTDGSNYLTIGGYKVMSMHDFMHLAMFPFKTICTTLSDSSFCLVSAGNEHNSYNQIGLSVMAYGKSQNIYVQNSIIFSLIALFVIVNILSTPAVLVSLILFKTMKKGTKIE